jgi:hypothetical protein
MSNSYDDMARYDQFLSQALQQGSEYQQLGANIAENYSNEYQQAKIGSVEAKTMGAELLFTTLPAAFPEVGRAIQKGAQVIKAYGELKEKAVSIQKGLQTLPDDLKSLAGDKYSQIETLVKDGSSKSIAQAQKMIDDLKSQGMAIKGEATSLVENAKSNISNIYQTAKGDLSKVNPDDIIDNVKKSIGYTEPSLLTTKDDLINNYKSLRSKLVDTVQTASDETDKRVGELRARMVNASDTEKIPIQNEIDKVKGSYNDLVGNLKGKLDNIKTEAINRATPTTTIADMKSSLSEEALSKLRAMTPEDILKSRLPESSITMPSLPSLSEMAEPTAVSEAMSSFKLDDIIAQPTSVAKYIGSKIGLSKTPVVPQELVDKYKQTRDMTDNLSSKLQAETDPAIRENLTRQLSDAKTNLSTQSRLIELEAPKTESLISSASEAGGQMFALFGGAASTAGELRGQVKGAGNILQSSVLQGEATGTLSKLGAQAVGKFTPIAQTTEKAVMEQGTATYMKGQEVASSAKSAVSSTLEQSKGMIGDLTESVASKSSGILESIAEKGVLETLGEVSGLDAIPVVGEVVSAAGLVWGAIDGIKDLFSHHSTPAAPVQQQQQASLVRQAGL